ncbi:hypothetical protein F4811DRAFT_565919 [Daldinia bambusicola]|nr:hypothetical protein F4811DRAFT_565919 [Daldinia bambusicola]
MGVSLQQAEKWECLESRTDPVSVYFATERTKSWETRLEEYHQRMAVVAEDETDEEQLEICSKRQRRIGTEFHGFMSLPRELRDMIYSYRLIKTLVLVRGSPDDCARCTPAHETMSYQGNIYPRYRGLTRGKTAGPIGLICGVSRSVHEEAIAIFYSCNRFVFPCDPRNLPLTRYFRSIGLDLKHSYYSLYNPLVRHVSYAFDMRGVTVRPYNFMQWRLSSRLVTGEDHPQLEPATYLMNMHNEAKHTLDGKWRGILANLSMMELDTLELSFEMCYCPMGCCRLVDEVLERFRTAEFGKGAPKAVEATGWKSEEEKERMRETLEGRVGKGNCVEVSVVYASSTQYP